MLLDRSTAGRRHTERAADEPPRATPPVKWWAALGALILAFEAFVVARWITGPLLQRVPVGPTPVPTFMKIAITVCEVASIPAALSCLYVLAIRPWRREGKLSVDGALAIAFATLWFQDPVSSYSGHWIAYNSWGINFGSWVNSIPYALGKAAPGSMLPEPILIMPGLFVWAFVGAMFTGTWVMRTARRRWPRLSAASLGIMCVAVMWLFDLIFEGLIFQPLGVWEYPGGHFSIFADTYHRYPLTEMATAGTFFGVGAILRYFKNDRGETWADRGVESLKVSERSKSILRALAVIGMVNVGMFIVYNIPNTWSATHSSEWPADLQKRSYFTDGICGAGTDQMCPGPAVPQFRNNNHNPRGGSVHLDPNGNSVVPPDTVLPALVPFEGGR